MGTFATAYLIVWAAVLLYVARLGMRQRRLAQDLEALQWQLDQTEDMEHTTPKVA